MPEAKQLKPIRLPCPMCGDEEADISVDLAHLDLECGQFHCNGCTKDFGRDRIRDIVRKWQPVLDWIDTVPVIED